jgi:hypothetical protein
VETTLNVADVEKTITKKMIALAKTKLVTSAKEKAIMPPCAKVAINVQTDLKSVVIQKSNRCKSSVPAQLLSLWTSSKWSSQLLENRSRCKHCPTLVPTSQLYRKTPFNKPEIRFLK